MRSHRAVLFTGSGAFGLVLRVRHKLDGKEYALKVARWLCYAIAHRVLTDVLLMLNDVQVMNKRVLERKLGAADSALTERHALRRLHTHPYVVQFHCAFQVCFVKRVCEA